MNKEKFVPPKLRVGMVVKLRQDLGDPPQVILGSVEQVKGDAGYVVWADGNQGWKRDWMLVEA